MKPILAIVAAVALLVVTSACASGPRMLSREWDDHVNQKYTENAWLHGAILQDVLPIYSLVALMAGVADVFIINPYSWWGSDAWDNRGTGFEHQELKDPEKSVGR